MTYYVEVFYDLEGRPWYRAVDPATRQEAIAATADQAVAALQIRLSWGAHGDRREDPGGVAPGPR